MSALGEGAIGRLLESGNTKAALSYLRATGQTDGTALIALAEACAKVKDNETFAQMEELFGAAELTADQKVRAVVLASNCNAHDSVIIRLNAMGTEGERFGLLELKARAYRATGKIEDAERVYLRMQELFPTTPKTWTNSASHYKSQGDSVQESTCLYQALKFKLKDVTILHRLAMLASAGKKNQEALELWRQIARLEPRNSEALYGVLRQLVRLKKWAIAKAWIAEKDDLLPAGEPTELLKKQVAQALENIEQGTPAA
jgi:tetratricopeptide (TPR) repeat protein